jgi:hypothetical protein
MGREGKNAGRVECLEKVSNPDCKSKSIIKKRLVKASLSFVQAPL